MAIQVKSLLCPNVMQLFLHGQRVEAIDWKRKEQTDSPVEHNECISKRALDLPRRPRYCRRIGNAPVRRHRLARPHGTNFVCGVVADGENKIHFRDAGFCELVPAFAAITFYWQ